MDNLKKTLPSGAILELSLCSFEEGNDLLKSVMKEIESLNISMGNNEIKDIVNMEINDEMINTVKGILSRVISSTEIERCLWRCLGRGTIDSKKISKDTFEDHQLRGDYLIVMKETLIYNLKPFFSSLGSMLSGLKRKKSDSQE